MGMDIDEYSDRSIAIGKGLMGICDYLYAAIEDKISTDELNSLLERGKRKIELFESLSAETTGGMREGLHKKYGDYMVRIRKYSQQLLEIYF